MLNKVIIPVAGLGTRMLPATKVIPKEMLPIVDKPIIQYVVEEVISAGFEEIILVTHSSKNSIENHFDTSFELETTLERRIKRSLLRDIKNISRLKSKIFSVRQGEAKGLGHAILQARELINGEAFAVVLPDRVMNTYSSNIKKDNLAKMKKEFLKKKESLILLEKVKKQEVHKYGIAKLRTPFKSDSSITRLEDIIEKPRKEFAPSQYAAVGRYIFENDIFEFIEQKSSKNKEIEITDAIKRFIKNGRTVNSLILKGECFDCGDKIGYLKSIVEIASNRKDLSKDFKKLLKSF
tara:strand:+ start:10990 stop:11871 length:882 start_codon:yes stop_codon:yes gene_type:complete